jgi:hypothetical protein
MYFLPQHRRCGMFVEPSILIKPKVRRTDMVRLHNSPPGPLCYDKSQGEKGELPFVVLFFIVLFQNKYLLKVSPICYSCAVHKLIIRNTGNSVDKLFSVIWRSTRPRITRGGASYTLFRIAPEILLYSYFLCRHRTDVTFILAE